MEGYLHHHNGNWLEEPGFSTGAPVTVTGFSTESGTVFRLKLFGSFNNLILGFLIPLCLRPSGRLILRNVAQRVIINNNVIRCRPERRTPLLPFFPSVRCHFFRCCSAPRTRYRPAVALRQHQIILCSRTVAVINGSLKRYINLLRSAIPVSGTRTGARA